jgi:23S rRNA pseudouridine2605 synthase
MERKPGHVSLERALSKLGLASRTQARALIEAGQVKVDGQVRTHPGFKVWPEKARIEIGGESARAAKPVALLLHKPRGVVTTRSDEKGRPTVFSLVEKEGHGHLVAVGRLDWATSGLLILTNDTRLAAWLADPVNGVSRTYLVSVRGLVEEESLARLRSGISDRGEKLSAEAVVLRKASRKESHLVVELKEGKNREVRRMFASVGHEVTRLKRVAYGSLELGELAPGACRELSAKELRAAFPGAPIKAPARTPE